VQPDSRPPAKLSDLAAQHAHLFEELAQLPPESSARQNLRDELVTLHLPLVHYLARRFAGRNEPMPDLVQVGTIGLIKAIDRFEADRGVEFPTFALPTISGEIKRFFRDTSWAVRVPRRLQELRLELAKATDKLQQDLDRAPTTPELARYLDLSEAEVVDGLRASNAYTAGSLDATTEDERTDSTRAHRLGYEDPGMAGIENHESLKPLIAELAPRDRLILSLRFVADKTQAEIGEELGISQMHVSRLLARTLGKLREGLLTED
jgi:RNA polymerase sigma-B factor